MTDLDPEIWNNPTLGAAANNTRLDALEKQEQEDRNAKIENRDPRPVVVDNNYPGWQPEGNVPSNAQVVRFADEQQNDIPVDSAPFEQTAGGIEGEAPVIVEGAAAESNSTPEGDSTQWT